MGPLNYMAETKRRSMTTLEVMDLEDENEQFGASRVDLENSRWICLYYVQSMPGYLSAYQTGKELSPAALEINKRYYYNENMKEFANGSESLDSLSKWMLSEEVLVMHYMRFCLEACPVGNEPMVDILRMRLDLYFNGEQFSTRRHGGF